MSSQKGNASRSRPQKYQNRHAFKNNLHDTSHKTKFINNINVANVCERCKQIIEWKIKYKKYKPLKAPAKCVKCEEKTIKFAYHTMCGRCAREKEVCPKCGLKAELVLPVPTTEEQVKLDTELQAMLKSLPERKRRTFIRYMNKKGKPSDGSDKGQSEIEKDGKDEEGDNEVTPSESQVPRTREELYEKLKSLKISHNERDEFDSEFDSDFDTDSEEEC